MYRLPAVVIDRHYIVGYKKHFGSRHTIGQVLRAPIWSVYLLMHQTAADKSSIFTICRCGHTLLHQTRAMNRLWDEETTMQQQGMYSIA